MDSAQYNDRKDRLGNSAGQYNQATYGPILVSNGTFDRNQPRTPPSFTFAHYGNSNEYSATNPELGNYDAPNAIGSWTLGIGAPDQGWDNAIVQVRDLGHLDYYYYSISIPQERYRAAWYPTIIGQKRGIFGKFSAPMTVPQPCRSDGLYKLIVSIGHHYYKLQ